MGLSRTVSEIDGDFSRKSQQQKIPPSLCVVPALKDFPLELGIGAGLAGVKKKQSDGATGPTKMFDDIFSLLDRMHERDRQTDTGPQQTALTHSVAR